MAFRIGRKHAQHTYPEAKFGAPALLQVSSDNVEDPFNIAGGQVPLRVERSAGVLLQAPLNNFHRSNGLWVQAETTLDQADAGVDLSISTTIWFKFASLPQYFVTGDVAAVVATSVVGGVQPLEVISITIAALFQLPAQSSDGAPIAFPAIDDLEVGIVGAGDADFVVVAPTWITAGEMNAGIIPQMPTVSAVTLV